MAFTALVNFQPAAAPVPAGYVADSGKVYAGRGNGYTYGWNLANNNAVDRNSSLSPDQRYDTFNYLKATNAGTVWELAVPAAGNYSVKIVAGDSNVTGGVQKITAEGAPVTTGTTTGSARWVTGTSTVAVADGRLTVKAAADASGVKINFIEVTQLTVSPPPPGPPPGPPPPPPPPPPVPAVSGFTLVNAATDKDVGPLTNGLVVNQAQVGSQLTVRAGLSNAPGGSVRFELDKGTTAAFARVDGGSPYTLFGDGPGAGTTPDYLPGPLPIGTHQLVVTPYAGGGATGTAGTPVTVSFTVVNTPPPSVGAVTLVDAAVDADLGSLFNGRTINLAETGPQLNVRAATTPSTTGSVRFAVDGVTVRIDNAAVYTLGGDAPRAGGGTDYLPWTPTVGAHRLVVTAYAGPDGSGAAGAAKTVDFTVVNAPPPAVAAVTLVNAATGADLGPLTAGRTINLALIGSQLNVRADVSTAGGSVRFALDGSYTKVESSAPYALFGDTAGVYNPWTPTVGTHTLTVTPYAGAGATGAIGQPVTVTFTVVNAVPPALGRLVLVDATSGQDVGTLTDGGTVDTAALGTALTVRADPAVGSAAPGSVAFLLDGQRYRLEQAAPYLAAGGSAAAPTPLGVTPGFHTLTVLPYSGPAADGLVGQGFTIGFTVTPLAPTVAPVAGLDADRVADLFAFADQQLRLAAADLAGTGKYPRVTGPDGKWSQTAATEWSSGFFPGSLWQMYRRTGDDYWKELAGPMSRGLKGNAAGTEDTAFKLYLPVLQAYATTGDPVLRDALLAGAAAKSTQFDPDVQAFRTTWRRSTSGDPRANFGVLMDQLMDTELMFWAARQTGNPTYYDQAVANARTVAEHLVRPDGGSFHWGYFDKDTGDFISGETAQGYANDSTWARGQSWGVYAFAMVYRETGLAEFLETSKKMSDYFVAHLPPDGVPYWDFDDPAAPDTFRDTSAGAIAAAGMLLLADLAPAAADQATYAAAGGKLLADLSAPEYLAEGTQSRSILNRGAWYVPAPINSGESGTVWGDYYFLEALNRYAGKL